MILFPMKNKNRVENSLEKLGANIFHYSAKTIGLKSGEISGIICLDVDIPNSNDNKKLIPFLEKTDWIIHSNKFTLEDVFAQKCKYKVFFKYDGEKIARTKNKSVEVFYDKVIAVAGSKDLDEEYCFSYDCEIRNINFDINEILEFKVKKFNLLKQDKKKVSKVKRKKIEKIEKEKEIAIEIEEHSEKCSIEEFKSILKSIKHPFIPAMNYKRDKKIIALNNCLFPDHHSNPIRAGIKKINGIYKCFCFGEACEGSGDYFKLNQKIETLYHSQKKYNFGENKNWNDLATGEVHVLHAPTGWGKTETNISDIMNFFNEIGNNLSKKKIVMVQHKAAIDALIRRLQEKMGKEIYLELLKNGRIMIWTGDVKIQSGAFENKIRKASVIITHHFYAFPQGDLILFHEKWKWIMKEFNPDLIIDEAQTFIETATRKDVKIGACYKRDFSGKWIQNREKFTKQQKLENPYIKTIGDCLEFSKHKIFKSVSLRQNSELYQEVKYVNLFNEIKQRFKILNDWEENNWRYIHLINEKTTYPLMKGEENENNSSYIDNLLNPTSAAIISINIGDEIPRKTIGDVYVSFFHEQFVNFIIKCSSRLILMGATINENHVAIIKNQLENKNLNEIIIPEKIDKSDNIVLLVKENDLINTREGVIETLIESESKALIFMPTKDSAEKLMKKYPENIMLNNNGRYETDYRITDKDYANRNITVLGLESGGAQGTNFVDELYGDFGLEIIYIEGSSVSPKILKKWIDVKTGEVIDYEHDYNIETMVQAIGRAFRKRKHNLTIVLNNTDEILVEKLIKSLKERTTANLKKGIYTNYNLQLTLESYLKTLDEKSIEIIKDNKIVISLYGDIYEFLKGNE